MKILLLDIETAPNLAAVWGLFKQNININMLLKSGYTLCWSAKWLGEDVIYFDSIYRSSPKQMIKRIHALLNEADAVIHYNGKKFDIPTLNKEFLTAGLKPPAPYRQIDLLTTARTQFRAPSNKLDYWAQELKIGAKRKTGGQDLFLKCMNMDKDAWVIMEDYNIQDVELLEKLYIKFLPWIKGHANHAVHNGELVCPNCGSKHYQKRGFSMSLAGKYQRFACSDCGTWFRSTTNVADKKKFVTTGV